MWYIVAAIAGYAVSIYTWPWIRTIAGGVEAEVAALKARIASLTGHIL